MLKADSCWGIKMFCSSLETEEQNIYKWVDGEQLEIHHLKKM